MHNKFQHLGEGGLRKIARASELSSRPNFVPARFWHVYIRLDFQKRFEQAQTKSDGSSFVRNVVRAANAAELVVSGDDGIVVEVQGSVIHCLLPDTICDYSLMRRKSNEINNILHAVFPDSSHVEGWRMAAEWGKTLLVKGRGIHSDDSFVSLGNSANAPAKHLFSQLALASEEQRKLKRFFLAWRLDSSGSWNHENLGDKPSESLKKEASARIEEIRLQDYEVKSVFSKSARVASGIINAQAAPVDTQNLPRNQDPIVYYGWVMRADIDGFTARVEECFDDDDRLMKLGESFEQIMDEAASFAEKHSELLVQLPWAGDNFTAVVVFSEKRKYEEAIQEKLIEFSIDYEHTLDSVVKEAGLGGWAQTVAGGETHGNVQGNVYVGSVEFEGRRFLIGAGQGVGRTMQAFSDMDPAPGEIIVYEEDYKSLLKPYKAKLNDRKKTDGTESSLFRRGSINDLVKACEEIRGCLEPVKDAVKTTVTIGASKQVLVSSRDYGKNSDNM